MSWWLTTPLGSPECHGVWKRLRHVDEHGINHERHHESLDWFASMIAKLLLRFFGGLKFPWLFGVTLALFGLDLIVPDFMPFADELLLGLTTLLLGAWRAKKSKPTRIIDVDSKSSRDEELRRD